MAELGDESENGVEQDPASHRPSFVPTEPPARRPSVTSTAPAPTSPRRPAPDSEAPSANFDGEDFLFHLYRGSELLQDNCVSEAKEELELALRVQPQDIEGQGLLGVVYFRLGLYPRAQEIYRDIIRVRPEEVSPRVNLALCYLKTGQSQLARECLEEVTARVPDHVRAWGYLGLVHERLADFEKARSAFERAGQPHLVRRMAQLIEQTAQVRESDPPERAEVRAAAADAVQELESDEPGFSRASAEPGTGTSMRAGRWRAVEPGEELPTAPRARRSSLPGRFGPAVPAIPEPVELSRSSLLPDVGSGAPPSIRAQAVGPEPVVAPSRRSALIEVTATWAVRGDAVRGLIAHGAAFTNTPLLRRMRGRDLNEPLGGPGSPWALLSGVGQILVGAAPERELSALELNGAYVYVRESCLVGYAGSAQHENGRLPSGGGEPVSMVQISGRGTVLIESRKPPRVLEVTENQKLAVRADDVVGWIGRLLGHPLDLESAPLKAPGFVAFSGSGSVLVDLG
ncbi:MAG TPA: tetratricopeptide repeat protein [Polyangiaceae bacterium]|nr:tetratricopeptide repeat protein [Polyangiaceae bacterium]